MKNGWQSKTLGALCWFIDYRGKTPKKTESGLRLITAKNVKVTRNFVADESVKPTLFISGTLVDPAASGLASPI